MVSETECREAFIALLERIVAGWGTWEDEKLGGGRRCRIGLRTIPDGTYCFARAITHPRESGYGKVLADAITISGNSIDDERIVDPHNIWSLQGREVRFCPPGVGAADPVHCWMVSPEEAGLMAAALPMVFGDDPTVERQIHSLRWIMGSVSPLVDSQGAFEW
jgi:hypothetical protein